MKKRKPSTHHRHQLWSRTDSYVVVAVIVALLLLLGSSVRANAILTQMDKKTSLFHREKAIAKRYIDHTLEVYKVKFKNAFSASLEPKLLLATEQRNYQRAAFDPNMVGCVNFRQMGRVTTANLSRKYLYLNNRFEDMLGGGGEGESVPKPEDFPSVNEYYYTIAEIAVYGYVESGLIYLQEPFDVEKDDWFEGNAMALYHYYKWLEGLTVDSPELTGINSATKPADNALQPRRVYLRLLKEVLTIPAGETGRKAYAAAAEVVPKDDGTPRTGDNVRRRYSDWQSKPHKFTAEEIALVVSELEGEGRHVNSVYLSAIYRNVQPV